ncbi:MAG: molybdenum cofactor guanylyltransferase [Ignavibacteriae bacterium]|nr:molybdenum cofactor guanylyltransferase [Ignavibacteriota bacterium]
MLNIANITGAILAGGKSSRMGENKALLHYSGKPFIQHIAETLKPACSHVIVISDRHEYAFLDLPMYADIIHDAGPLGGIHSALTHATTSMIFVLSCDTPFVTTALVQEILSQAHPDKITIAKDDANSHPLIGVYPKNILAELDSHLSNGNRSVYSFLHWHTDRLTTLDLNRFADQLRNINTKTDYDLLR